MRHLFTILIISLMLLSCKSYRLSKNDLEWQPYKEGDVLVFVSNKGEADTIQIKNIDIHTNANDPLAIFPTMLQSLFVSGVYYHEPKKDIMGRMYNSSYRDILEMESNNTGSYITFTLHLGNHKLRYPRTLLTIKELGNLKEENCQYIIEAKEHYDNMKDYPFDLRYIYWSKVYGYLGLEFKDNYVWTLKSFMREGKEIYSITQNQ